MKILFQKISKIGILR